MAYSTRDLADVAEKDGGIKLTALRADGGASVNDFLTGFIASVLGKKVIRPAEKESTALGAAYLCGIGLGIFTVEDLKNNVKDERTFEPERDEKYERYYREWKKSIERCLI